MGSKTMVTRASYALNKSIPELVQETGLDGMRISRRFHHMGPVMVLQVDLKPTELPDYIAEVKGEDMSAQYRAATSCLKVLGATDSLGALEKEMLPQVRKGLMEKFSNVLVQKMRAKDAMLEVQCIAL